MGLDEGIAGQKLGEEDFRMKNEAIDTTWVYASIIVYPEHFESEEATFERAEKLDRILDGVDVEIEDNWGDCLQFSISAYSGEIGELNKAILYIQQYMNGMEAKELDELYGKPRRWKPLHIENPGLENE